MLAVQYIIYKIKKYTHNSPTKEIFFKSSIYISASITWMGKE